MDWVVRFYRRNIINTTPHFQLSDFVDGFEHEDLGNRLGPRTDVALASVFRSSAQISRDWILPVNNRTGPFVCPPESPTMSFTRPFIGHGKHWRRTCKRCREASNLTAPIAGGHLVIF